MSRNWQSGGERGQELVEFALILPLLLLLVLGIIELAALVLDHNTLSNAAREGARLAVIQGTAEQQVRDVVKARALGLGLTDANVQVSYLSGSNTVQVAVTCQHRLLTGALLGFFGGNPVVQMRTVSTMLRE